MDEEFARRLLWQLSRSLPGLSPPHHASEEHVARLKAEAEVQDYINRLRVAQEQLVEYAAQKEEDCLGLLQVKTPVFDDMGSSLNAMKLLAWHTWNVNGNPVRAACLRVVRVLDISPAIQPTCLVLYFNHEVLYVQGVISVTGVSRLCVNCSVLYCRAAALMWLGQHSQALRASWSRCRHCKTCETTPISRYPRIARLVQEAERLKDTLTQLLQQPSSTAAEFQQIAPLFNGLLEKVTDAATEARAFAAQQASDLATLKRSSAQVRVQEARLQSM